MYNPCIKQCTSVYDQQKLVTSPVLALSSKHEKIQSNYSDGMRDKIRLSLSLYIFKPKINSYEI